MLLFSILIVSFLDPLRITDQIWNKCGARLAGSGTERSFEILTFPLVFQTKGKQSETTEKLQKDCEHISIVSKENSSIIDRTVPWRHEKGDGGKLTRERRTFQKPHFRSFYPGYRDL